MAIVTSTISQATIRLARVADFGVEFLCYVATRICFDRPVGCGFDLYERAGGGELTAIVDEIGDHLTDAYFIRQNRGKTWWLVDY